MLREGIRSRPRIGIGGFLHETNTFAPSKAGYDAFLEGGGWPGLCRGAAVVESTRGVNVSIAGVSEVAVNLGWDLVPTLWCAASPSGPVCRGAYERIAGEMVDGFRNAGQLDGIYLDLHGAMATEHLDDGEGELLRRIRRAVGPNVPIVASLDLHANVSRQMVDEADILVAFRTYPHLDMAETGARAAATLAELLGGQTRPAKAFRQIPFLIPIVWQRTDVEPCREIFAELTRMETGTITSLSFAPGFPASDFPDCRPSVLAYAASEPQATAAADRLADFIAARENAFEGTLYPPDDAVRMAMTRGAPGRPVVIADVQDNPGAGSNSDTTGLLRALVMAGARHATLGLLVDPGAVAEAHQAGVGSFIRVPLGGKSGVLEDTPLEAEYIVEALSDGKLTTSGPYYGVSPMDLGPSACLRLGGVWIIVSSRKAQMADQEMFRFLGVEPREHAIVVVKSSVHFRADFEPIAQEVLLCASPGSMPMDTSLLPWKHLAECTRVKPNGPSFRREKEQRGE